MRASIDLGFGSSRDLISAPRSLFGNVRNGRPPARNCVLFKNALLALAANDRESRPQPVRSPSARASYIYLDNMFIMRTDAERALRRLVHLLCRTSDGKCRS